MAASAVFRLVPRAGDGRTLYGKRSSPARGTSFSSGCESLRMQVFDCQRPLSSVVFDTGVGPCNRIARHRRGTTGLHASVQMLALLQSGVRKTHVFREIPGPKLQGLRVWCAIIRS